MRRRLVLMLAILLGAFRNPAGEIKGDVKMPRGYVVQFAPWVQVDKHHLDYALHLLQKSVDSDPARPHVPVDYRDTLTAADKTQMEVSGNEILTIEVSGKGNIITAEVSVESMLHGQLRTLNTAATARGQSIEELVSDDFTLKKLAKAISEHHQLCHVEGKEAKECQ